MPIFYVGELSYEVRREIQDLNLPARSFPFCFGSYTKPTSWK